MKITSIMLATLFLVFAGCYKTSPKTGDVTDGDARDEEAHDHDAHEILPEIFDLPEQHDPDFLDPAT